MRRNLKAPNPSRKEKAYKAIVRPQLEYAASVWDPHIQEDILKIEMFQRRAARWVLGDYSPYSDVSDMLDKLGWRSLEQRRSDSRLINSIHVINICTKANWTLGFLRRIYACPQEVKEAAYKGLVGPVLVYGSDWDPSGVGLQNELEKVQNRAAWFVTGNYKFETGSMTCILEHLKLESLKKRRRGSRLILLYKGLKDKASIRTDDLIPLVTRCRNDNSMAYQVSIT